VKAKPGLRIDEINKELGTTTKDLALPIRKLIADGMLTAKGQKRSTPSPRPPLPRARARRIFNVPVPCAPVTSSPECACNALLRVSLANPLT
jgi:hypothetical protein